MVDHRPGEFSSFNVVIGNYRNAVERALQATETSLGELRTCWNEMDWNAQNVRSDLERIQRVLGIIISQLAQKDREMERYDLLLRRDHPQHIAHLKEVRASMDLIRKEVRDESSVEHEEHKIHALIRDEEHRLSSMLKQVAVSLRRSNHPDHEAISVAYHLIEPILVNIGKHERSLIGDLDALLTDERRAA